MPLYVVATPIGNLQDLTARAREVLASCDGVVAEDTRYTGQLLKHLGIEKKPFHALPAYDEERRADAVPRTTVKLAGLLVCWMMLSVPGATPEWIEERLSALAE